MLCLLRLQWLTVLALATGAMAGGPIPAVDLPSVVPDFVRDQTARTLASTRDTLSWTVHPFRGEFHGLGTPGGGSSAAYDLSANGRVVVGADRNSAGGSEGFVWSPWTGRSTYNMRPPGVAGNVTATAISADGVYVAGDVKTPNGDVAFRWSLAGRELIPAPLGGVISAASISGNGGVVVGTSGTPSPIIPILHDSSPVTASTNQLINDDVARDPNGGIILIPITPNLDVRAYQYTRLGGVQDLGVLDGYQKSSAVDVSADGGTTLGNASGSRLFQIPRTPQLFSEPFLWSPETGYRTLGGLERNQQTDSELVVVYRPQVATARDLSADGSTVVGVDTLEWLSYTISDVAQPIPQPITNRRAVLWQEESGWIDLGELKTTGLRYQRGAEATGVSGDGAHVIGEATIETLCLVCNCPLGGCGPPEEVPFLWDEQRGMRDLADVLSLDYGLNFDDWLLGEATAISDDGTTIIGNGTNPNGDPEAWRAVLDRSTPDGDLDFDGDVDHHDYQTLSGNLGLDSETDAVFYADGDLNADGLVDQTDADAFLSRYENRWMGDFNADGLVDLADYTFWRDRAGLFTGGLADSNGDGWVNQTDLAAWRTHFGMAIDAIRARSVPEPTALAGLMAGLLSVACRRRRA